MTGTISKLDIRHRSGLVRMDVRIPERTNRRFAHFRARDILGGILFTDLRRGLRVSFEPGINDKGVTAERVRVQR